MKIIAKRPFISSRSGVGNVPQGRILDIDDAYAQMLIKSGLVEKYSTAPALVADRQPSFISPVGASAKNGQSSQAAPVLPKRIVTKSATGARKTKTAK